MDIKSLRARARRAWERAYDKKHEVRYKTYPMKVLEPVPADLEEAVEDVFQEDKETP